MVNNNSENSFDISLGNDFPDMISKVDKQSNKNTKDYIKLKPSYVKRNNLQELNLSLGE